MHRRYALWMLMSCLTLLLAACGHPWKTARQAVPNPFYGKGPFGVVPVTFHGLAVGDTTEAGWMADKDAEQRANWQEDKAGINEKFAEELIDEAASDDITVVKATGPAAAPFIVRLNVTFYEPGIYTGFFNRDTLIKATAQITDPTGMVLDEVLFEAKAEATLLNPSSGGRARDAAAQIGKLTAMYIRYRVRGED